MTEENTFRKTTPVPTHDSAAGQSVSASTESTVDFAMLEPRDQLKTLLQAEMKDKPFSELSSVLFDHRGASIVGHILLDTLEEAGYSVDDFDAVGALTAAAVPLVSAMIQAAASRGEDLDGFVMDFVYPSIKGPSIAGKRVVLIDSWLSEKSYVQTSSLVTLRNGNELSLDFSVVENEGAKVLAVASLIGRCRHGRPDHQGHQPGHFGGIRTAVRRSVQGIRTPLNTEFPADRPQTYLPLTSSNVR